MPDSTPTGIRHQVIGVCSLMGVLLYLDRFCVSFAEVFIKEDLGLTATDISLMFGAFFASYALGQTPSGWLADRFGGRRMLTLFILSWSLFTALLGVANGILVLVVLRLGMGFAQAGAFPTAASMISRWVPPARRGVASSLVALGGRIGGALSLFITGFVILYFVPVSVDSQMRDRDLLRADRLCYELRYGARPLDSDDGSGGLPETEGARILASFSSELQRQVAEQAEAYRAAAQQADPPGTPSPADSAPATLRSSLAAELNGLLAIPEFFVPDELQEIKLEREAERLLKRDRAVLAQPQVERMNRLVLEALYPACIRKVYGAGWRQMALLYGAIGIPVAMLFWVVCRDEPRGHPRCNEAERALIEVGRVPQEATESVGHLPLRELATSRTMWFNGAMQFFTNIGWIFLMTYLPRYLIEVHRVPVAERAWMSALPTVVAIVGMFCGGFLADRMAISLGKRWGRSVPIAVTRFAAAGGYLACLASPSPLLAITLLSATAFFCDLGIPAVWAFQQDIGGRHTGSVLGWGNMWGNFGAAVGPYLIGWISGDGQNWNGVFLTCAAAFMLSGLVGLGVDARRKVVADRVPAAGESV